MSFRPFQLLPQTLSEVGGIKDGLLNLNRNRIEKRLFLGLLLPKNEVPLPYPFPNMNENPVRWVRLEDQVIEADFK
jgi:hypothetical protein